MTEKEFEKQFADATQRGAESFVSEARAVSAVFHRETGEMEIGLRGGARLFVPVILLQGVAGKEAALIEKVELCERGAGLHWEELDADFRVQGLVAGSFGSPSWMQSLENAGLLDAASRERREVLQFLQSTASNPAAQLGQKGGSAKTAAKAAASRANGAKGGRPRKVPLAA